MASELRDESVSAAPPPSLKDAVRSARIEAAERSSVVVDLRDAELARLELLDEMLDPLFEQIPAEVDLFDRGVSEGALPRLWIDVVAHVEMARDKRLYRFVQDTRFGRKVLAESYEPKELVDHITRYIARRLVEREHALAEDYGDETSSSGTTPNAPVTRWSRAWMLAFGLIAAAACLFVLTYLYRGR